MLRGREEGLGFREQPVSVDSVSAAQARPHRRPAIRGRGRRRPLGTGAGGRAAGPADPRHQGSTRRHLLRARSGPGAVLSASLDSSFNLASNL